MSNLNKTFAEKVDEMSPLIQLLGEERVENIKDKIANLIINKVADDIENYATYLFYPPDYEYIICDAMGSVEKKIKKLYADAALDIAEKSVQKFTEQMLGNNDKS